MVTFMNHLDFFILLDCNMSPLYRLHIEKHHKYVDLCNSVYVVCVCVCVCVSARVCRNTMRTIRFPVLY